jgi:hypothetical protein
MNAIGVTVEVNAVAVRVQFLTELVGQVESVDHLVDFRLVRFCEVDPQQVVVFERLVNPRLDGYVSVLPLGVKEMSAQFPRPRPGPCAGRLGW